MLRFVLMLMVTMPNALLAETKTAPASGTELSPALTSSVSVMISMFVVIGVIIALAVFYKRMNLGFAGSQSIKVVTALPLGTKERIVVIEVNGQQHLIGVTPQQINHLVTLDEPIERTEPTNLGMSFQKILQGAKKTNE